MARRRLGLQHIETFRAVAMAGSMTRAAQALHTSQPQVSRLIAQLEVIAGFALFDRNGTRIALNADGKKFFDEVETTFAGLSTLEMAAESIRSFRSEHLRVTAMPRLAGSILTEVVLRMKRDHPELMISIHSGSASAVQGWISTGACDAGLAMLYGEDIVGVDCIPVSQAPCVCILPKGHPLSRKDTLTPEDFDRQDLVAFVPGSQLRHRTDQLFARSGARPRIVAETDLGASACRMVAEGLGIALINPRAAVEEATQFELDTRPFLPALPVTLAVIFPPLRRHGRLTTQFEATARAVVAGTRSFG